MRKRKQRRPVRLFLKISNISHKNMTFSRFRGVFCLALLARILVGKSRIDPWRASYRGGGTHAV
jgi:hypothetical protein